MRERWIVVCWPCYVHILRKTPSCVCSVRRVAAVRWLLFNYAGSSWRKRKKPLHAPYHFLTWRPAHNQINQHPRGEGFEYCNSIGREKLKWRTYTPNNPIRVSTAIAIMIAFTRKMNEWKIHEHTALDVYTVAYLMSSRCFIRIHLHRWLLLDLRSSFLFPAL